jgi:DNA-3-methyladenine glycosylase I
MNKDSISRCSWADNKFQEMQLYHDTEWGVPVHQDTKLFEFLVLEGAQAGLSWSTILKKRQDYRRAFDNFDIKRVSKFKIDTVDKLLTSPNINIVRNRLKLNNFFKDFQEIPVRSVESDNLSKDLKARGFSFVGSTICYAMMRAVGLVNDHTTNCFRHKELLEIK